MANILNVNDVPDSCIMDFLGKANTSYLGKAVGSEKIYVNIDRILPGFRSTKYHSHTKQEEFFIILSGCGTLRIGGEEHLINKGDFISKPAGKGLAHQFINTGDETLEILDVGTKEEGDIAYYPDEDTYYLSDEELVFSGGDKLNDWDSEPNK